MKKKWIIGTRGSKLALIQTDIVRDGLSRLYPEMEFTIKVIKTTGDSIWETPLYLIGSKGLFIKEIEEELVAGGIDLAVHSVKDLPTELSDGLCLSAVLKREDPRDAFISLKYDTLLGVRQGARIGTSSMRRKAQIAALRPDIEVVPLRGNVDTRVRKLEAGDLDAVILACAGVMRMGLRESIKEAILPRCHGAALRPGGHRHRGEVGNRGRGAGASLSTTKRPRSRWVWSGGCSWASVEGAACPLASTLSFQETGSWCAPFTEKKTGPYCSGTRCRATVPKAGR